jgi:transcriptional regulator with XRE-family HTH domain
MPNNPFLADIPARHYLRDWREKVGLSQEELGKKVGTTGATISRYEKGDRGLPLELQLKLFDALGILPGQFFAPPETPDLNTFAVNMTAKDRRALIDTIGIATGLTPEECSKLLATLNRVAVKFVHKQDVEELSPQSPQSTHG